jgi:hypothetical protein
MGTQIEQQKGQWAIVEIMGRKVVAGYITQAVQFGLPMLRIDVPETSIFPEFTQEYGAQAIYAITYVSEQVARMTSEANKVNPVAVYVPDLAEMQRAQLENKCLHEEIRSLRALPAPSSDGDEDDSNEDDDYENCSCPHCVCGLPVHSGGVCDDCLRGEHQG